MDLWNPYYLKCIFDVDREGEDVDLLNCSVSDMQLLNSVEKKEHEPYVLIVEDITMDDDQLLQVVNEIEQG